MLKTVDKLTETKIAYDKEIKAFKQTFIDDLFKQELKENYYIYVPEVENIERHYTTDVFSRLVKHYLNDIRNNMVNYMDITFKVKTENTYNENEYYPESMYVIKVNITTVEWTSPLFENERFSKWIKYLEKESLYAVALGRRKFELSHNGVTNNDKQLEEDFEKIIGYYHKQLLISGQSAIGEITVTVNKTTKVKLSYVG